MIYPNVHSIYGVQLYGSCQENAFTLDYEVKRRIIYWLAFFGVQGLLNKFHLYLSINGWVFDNIKSPSVFWLYSNYDKYTVEYLGRFDILLCTSYSYCQYLKSKGLDTTYFELGAIDIDYHPQERIYDLICIGEFEEKHPKLELFAQHFNIMLFGKYPGTQTSVVSAIDAARLYARSKIVLDLHGNDPWGFLSVCPYDALHMQSVCCTDATAYRGMLDTALIRLENDSILSIIRKILNDKIYREGLLNQISLKSDLSFKSRMYQFLKIVKSL